MIVLTWAHKVCICLSHVTKHSGAIHNQTVEGTIKKKQDDGHELTSKVHNRSYLVNKPVHSLFTDHLRRYLFSLNRPEIRY